MSSAPPSAEVRGELTAADGRRFPFRVVGTTAHALEIALGGGLPAPSSPEEFAVTSLGFGDRSEDLGPSRYVPNDPAEGADAASSPPAAGDGRLVPLAHVYDFSSLLTDGAPRELAQKLRQLPLLWNRRKGIRPSFRAYAADLHYDLQVYRGVVDGIDRNLEVEPEPSRSEIRAAAVRDTFPGFCALFDERMIALEDETAGFLREEHEAHGFYFRKQVWDLIEASAFLRRTNLKPRGYAGDSEMMRMVYDDAFVDGSIFAQLLHRHPIQTTAADAVRNRRRMVARIVSERRADRPGRRVRVMSVACGPACELRDMVRTPADAEGLELVLLDQDAAALAEAQANRDRLAAEVGAAPPLRLVQDSVRTMLRTRDLSSRWGRFDVIYTLGLFDYLTTRVARAVLGRLYELVLPGGELVVGNFHERNPTRAYMEYWMDWVLVYRREDELLDLARDLPGAQTSLSFDQTGIQIFLRLRKPS